jgi:hypothetical protein
MPQSDFQLPRRPAKSLPFLLIFTRILTAKMPLGINGYVYFRGRRRLIPHRINADAVNELAVIHATMPSLNRSNDCNQLSTDHGFFMLLGIKNHVFSVGIDQQDTHIVATARKSEERVRIFAH